MLLTKQEDKMANYWSSSSFFFVFIDWDKVKVNKHAKKKETISSHIDRISLVSKGFITIIHGQ